MSGKRKATNKPLVQENPALAAGVDSRIEMTLGGLAAFPELKEGYLTKKGIYFDRTVAESTLEKDEELIIIKRPSKK